MKLSIAIAKAGRSIDVDTDRLVADGQGSILSNILQHSPKLAYVLNYGLTQTLNDAHASPKFKGADVIMAVVQKKLDSIYAGTVKTRGSGATRETDPIAAEAMRLTKAWWKKQDQKKAIADARAKYPGLAGKKDDEVMFAIVRAYINNPATVQKAKDLVAAKAKKVDFELDLSDFMPDESDDNESDDEVLMIEDQS